jgi:hypothetical protein
MLDQFLKRLPAEAKAERDLITQAFGLPNAVKGKVTEIRKDARLSEDAKRDDIRSMVLGTPLAHLKQLHGRVAAMTADLTNLKKTFAPKVANRADVFGEMERRELRDYVRSLPPEKRLRAVMDDPALTEAVLLGHPSLSGLSTHSEDGAPSQFDIVRESFLEQTYGAQLRGVEAREQVLEVVNSALKVAIIQFRAEGGLNESEMLAALS